MFELAIGLGGIAVGWLLSLGQTLWRERHAGKVAARLVHVELMAAHSRIVGMSQMPQRFAELAGTELRRNAWETHAHSVASVAKPTQLQAIIDAYYAMDAVHSQAEKFASDHKAGGLATAKRAEVLESLRSYIEVGQEAAEAIAWGKRRRRSEVDRGLLETDVPRTPRVSPRS